MFEFRKQPGKLMVGKKKKKQTPLNKKILLIMEEVPELWNVERGNY